MSKPPEIAPTESKASGAMTVPTQLRGDTISFALQHIVHNMAANFYEPAVDTYLQHKYYDQHKKDEKGYGSYSQNLAGQVVGDIAGGGALIAAELLVPNQLHAFTRAARRVVDPMYDSLARKVLSDQRTAPNYEQQVRQWKTYQERSLVRSAIMGAASIGANIATQKAIGNPSPKRVIFATKLITTALTTVLTLASRFMFPESSKKFDNWVNNKVVQPLLSDTPPEPPASHVDKLLKNNSENALTAAR